MRIWNLIAWALIPLTGCGLFSYQASYNGSISFNRDIKEPLFVQVYNNDLSAGKTDNHIIVELIVDRTWFGPGDTFRRVILSGSNANCTAKDYLRGKLESNLKGTCDFQNGWFEEAMNGKKTGKTIKVEFDQTVRDGERERLSNALRSP